MGLPASIVGAAAAGGLGAAGAVAANGALRGWRRRVEDRAAMRAAEGDRACVLLSDARGRVLARNAAARDGPLGPAATVAGALEPLCAVPGETVARLADVATREGASEEAAASEVIVTPDGPADFTVLFLGPDRLLWRLEMRDRRRESEAGAQAGRQDVAAGGAGAAGDDLFEALPVALVKLSPTGKVLGANTRARDLVPALAEPDRTLAGVVEGLGRSVGQWVSEAAAGRGLNRPETLPVTGSSPERYVQVTLTTPSSPLAGEAGLVAVMYDVTEMKVLEAQFVQSQNMQAIGQLAGGIAHDFNNLLTAISGHCDLLLIRIPEDDPSGDDLRQISRNAARAAALVGQLLAFSRKQKLTMREVDLRETLGGMIHLLDRLVGDRVRLAVRHDPALMPIRADIAQLEQVLMNLVVNARDAMPDGGTVRIETACRFLATPMARDRVTVPSGQYVCVTVADEGLGIAPDKLPRIFEPFFTTKRQGEGTGLGLAMAYGVMKQSGGYIFADSVPGEGATFTLYFPAGDARSEPAPGPGSGEVVPLHGQRRKERVRQDAPAEAAAPLPDLGRRPVVLLAEDETPVRAFAARVLGLKGFEVLEAADGEEALEILSDPDLLVDAFVSDVMMPGLDGPSWVAQALEDRPGVHTVFMSGYAEEAMPEAREPTPNSTFIAKPFSLDVLAQAVHEAVDAGRAAEPAPAPARTGYASSL
jgi:two-component system cell cycle sensor histidine kinase/response regulator CckA